MKIDLDKIDDAVLGLLWLTLHDERRAWKGFVRFTHWQSTNIARLLRQHCGPWIFPEKRLNRIITARSHMLSSGGSSAPMRMLVVVVKAIPWRRRR
jgi:hypothetical protein